MKNGNVKIKKEEKAKKNNKERTTIHFFLFTRTTCPLALPPFNPNNETLAGLVHHTGLQHSTRTAQAHQDRVHLQLVGQQA